MRSDSESFCERTFDPSEWRKLAGQLFSAATALEPSVDEFWNNLREGTWQDGLVAIYFMLCAYALENLMKAILVEIELANKPKPKKLSRLPDSLKGHDLVQLAIRCGKRDLAVEYSSILKRLSRSAVWYGRYPVPISSSNLKAFETALSGEQVSLTMYSRNDAHEVKKLLREFGLDCAG